MLLRNDAEKVLQLVDLKDGEPKFLACEGLRAEKASGGFFSCRIVVD